MKSIGFDENQKCCECNLLAYYEVEGKAYCSNHFDQWLENLKNAERDL